ncbi:MAG: hypothetical protein R3E79_62085 [Caldilineaceae bacterium]
MNASNTLLNHQYLKITGRMRSRRGLWGVIVLLALLPLAALYQQLFVNGFETFIHWVLAIGAGLLAWAVFDFRKLPQWLNWAACLLLGTEAAIFFLQGLSHLLQNETFTYVAYQVLGQALEVWLPRLFILVWCSALLLLGSQGKTRVFGWVVLPIFIGVEIVRITLAYQGATPSEIFKVVILLPLVWLLLESKKTQPQR